MRILITGSKGLIGTALRASLNRLGIEVIGLDIAEESEHEDHGSILDFERLYAKAQGVDGIVHLAAVSRVITGEKFPELCWKTNVEGTQNVIEIAKSTLSNPWVLYASSREVYGQQDTLPVKESAPLRPANIYGESKVAAEERVRQGGQTAIVRFSNVYGSVHDHVDRVIPAFCYAAAEGKEIRVEGQGNLFDFTYIEDVVHGLLALIHRLSEGGESITPVHFVSGVPASLGEVARIAQRISDHSITLKECPSRTFDASRFYGDPERAQQLLGWRACVSIEEGMCRLYRQYCLSSKLVSA